MKSFEWLGEWWLPDDEENPVAGILKYDPITGIKLELLGRLNVTESCIKLNNDPIPCTAIILGKTANRIVTLCNCFESQYDFIYNRSSVFNVDFIFSGHHFKKIEEIIFDRININYLNLNNWFNKSGLGMEVPDDKLKPTKFLYNKPNAENVKVGNFEMSFQHIFLPMPYPPNEIDLLQKPFIKIESPQTHFRDFKTQLNILNDFLSFGIGKPTYPLYIQGFNDVFCHKILGKKNCPAVDIYYRVNSIIPEGSEISSLDMFFSFSDIADIFDKCLNNWFSNAKRFEPVHKLYVGTLYKSMYIEHKFLSVIQAIEAYHSRISPKKIKTHKMKRRWYLKERFESLFVNFNNIFALIISNHNDFIENVVNTRNYFTHYSEGMENNSKFEGDELIVATDQLKFIIEVCLLFEMGFSEDKIRKLVISRREYQYLYQRLENQQIR